MNNPEIGKELLYHESLIKTQQNKINDINGQKTIVKIRFMSSQTNPPWWMEVL